MYSMVLMAALTTATDMPDRHQRGGGCCGCYGGMSYGMGYGGCYGMGYGGCYGRGYGGYGMGYGGYGMGYGGGYAMGNWGGWGYGYSGYVLGGGTPVIGGYAYSPMISNGAILNPGGTRSLYYNPAIADQANEATIVVHLPQDANLTIDGEPTQSRSATRVFRSPPLEPGKTYVYTLRAEANRDGHFVNAKKTVEIRAGKRSEVTLHFNNANRDEQSRRSIVPDEDTADRVAPPSPRRTPASGSKPTPRSFPTPPPER
ncbi:MAG: TIGR03000 domain-containing protein [Gemmataceae bacterium]